MYLLFCSASYLLKDFCGFAGVEHLHVIHVSQISEPFASMMQPVKDRLDVLMPN